MKFFLIFLLSSCAAFNSKNINSVQIGAPEEQLTAGYRIIQTRESGHYKVFALDDGFVVTDRKKIVHKTDLQHPYDNKSEVSAATLVPNKKFKYFVKADPKTIDSKSIFFITAKKQVEAMLALNGEMFVKNEADATANLYVSYAVTGQHTQSLTQGLMVISKETTYTRYLLLTASTDRSEANLWETKVISTGPSNDMNIILPGHIVAAGKFINKSSMGPVVVETPGTSIVLNIIKNPDAFSPYLDNELASN